MTLEEEAELDRMLAERPKLRCKGKECDMRKGFFVRKEQKGQILKKKCLLCNSDIVDINPVEN